VVLYVAVRLVRVVDELHLVRSELAEVAVGRERLRFSRDLHDLLGQSLSAIALKGDLALRLLRRDPEAARTEVVDMTSLARDTLHGMRAVAHDEHTVSLAQEADGAAALLAAAGITSTVDVSSAGLADTTQEMFAWAVREGVTNILRHSDAQACSITVAWHDGQARLTIVSDGARPPARSGDGTGLAGLADRAAALSGSVTAGRGGGDLFHLVVEIPEEAT
jgi:two-component system sensor histidine kinase DesK